MSWFSNQLPASFKAPESHHGDGEQEDEHTLHGKGVKEDLSELTKTFTRQLWGVASFLAPPPTAKSVLQEVDPSSPSSAEHHIQPDLQIDFLSHSGEISSLNELVEVDFQGPLDPAEHLQEEAFDCPQTSGQFQTTGDDTSLSPLVTSDHGLTGISKDLAELKGSVATGFSKILKAVREEIDRNEHAKKQVAYDDDDEEDEDNDDDADDESNSYVHSGRLPVLNSIFKPLLSGILHNDRDEMPNEGSTDSDVGDEDEESFDDDPLDERGHQKSRPFGALNLQHTLGESLGGVSKLASTLFPVNLDSDDEQHIAETSPNFEVVGVTEGVLAFARNISMHPETWLDFPLFTDDEDDDFEMSDAQKEHVKEVQHASPRFAALRIELCPDYISEGRFWKTYFVLLHSRLNKKDAVLLSTPQIMDARARLLSNLQNKESEGSTSEYDGQHELEKDSSGSTQSFKVVSLQLATDIPAEDFDQIENHGASHGRPRTSGDIMDDTLEEVQNKNVLASTVKLATTLNYGEEEADSDKWLHEESSPHLSSVTVGLDNEDDVSFSDLEEDDGSLMSKGVGSSNFKGTQGWVQLNKDQEEQGLNPGRGMLDGERNALSSKMQDRREANDWLTVEEEDSDFA